MTRTEGDDEAMAMSLTELENRIAANKQKTQDIRNSLFEQIKQRGLKKGRVRPRDPEEAIILDILEDRQKGEQ